MATRKEIEVALEMAPADTVRSVAHWVFCEACPLCETRKNVVLGRGNLNAEVMLIGEGPGPTEDDVGYPFAGKSGDLLDEFLLRAKWPRETVFVDNAVACFPSKVNEKGDISSRKPSTVEMKACQQRLWETIYAVDPLLIIALGATAIKSLTGIDKAISTARGELYIAKVPGYYKKVSYPVFPTYHPAFLLRNPNVPVKENLKKSSPVYQAWEDFSYARQLFDKLKEKYNEQAEQTGDEPSQ